MAELFEMYGVATVAVYLLRALWERALFMRVMDDPVKGKLASAASAYLTCSVILGAFSGAALNTFYWSAFLFCLLPGITVAGLAYRRGIKLRQEASGDVSETAT